MERLRPPPVLLVEDNEDDVALTLRAFRQLKLGNEICVAQDGVEALQLLLGPESGYPGGPAEQISPALILLDVKLPRLGGLETLERLRAHPRTRRLPVVMLTSSAEEPDLQRSYDLGANSYVRKPVEYSQFLEATRQLGLYWLLLNQVPRETVGDAPGPQAEAPVKLPEDSAS